MTPMQRTLLAQIRHPQWGVCGGAHRSFAAPITSGLGRLPVSAIGWGAYESRLPESMSTEEKSNGGVSRSPASLHRVGGVLCFSPPPPHSLRYSLHGAEFARLFQVVVHLMAVYRSMRSDVLDYIERFHNPRMQRRLDSRDQKFIA